MTGFRRAVALAVAAAAAGCGGGDAPAGAPAEPSAATWRTWVLSSPGEVPVPPPAGDDEPQVASERVAARAARASALTPWLEHVLDQVAARAKDPPAASRNYAYVSVAMYDAAVAAAHWQRKHDSGSYPSAETAAAAAGARVIAALYPDAPAAVLDRDLVEAGRLEVAAGRATPDGVRAGEALGRAVAARVLARARSDGAERPWRGRVPRRRGGWAPPPGSAARPVQPGAGRWRTWVLRSGDELRAPPPPPFGSAAFIEQARAVMRAKERLTERQRELAHFWEGGEGTELPPGIWIRVAMERMRRERASLARQARVFALLTVAMADAGVAAWDTKYAYWYPRPENAIRDLGLDPDWVPEVPTPIFPAYVSGHSTYSAAAGEVLSYLFPDEAAAWRRRAKEASVSRLWGGIHFPVDSTHGERMGLEIGRRVVRRSRHDGAGDPR